MIKGLSQVGGLYQEASNSNDNQFYLFEDIPFYEASKDQIDLALDQAALAFEESKSLSPQQLARLLSNIADEINSHKEIIIQTYQSESHYGQGRANGEFGRTISQIGTFVRLLEKGQYLQAKIDHSTDATPDLRKVLVPIGPIAVFGASNFPLAFSSAGGDTISALASGCPVIIKGHPFHPATSELVASCMIQAVTRSNLHPGLVAHLHGADYSIGQRLIMHPKLKGVGFTGSHNGGKALFDLAQKRSIPIPVFAEMGSVNPIIILRDKLNSDQNLANQIAESVLLGSGQFCTNPGLIFIQTNDSQHSFIQDFINKITSTDINQFVHGDIHKNYVSKIQNLKEGISDLKLYQSKSSLGACGVVGIDQLHRYPDLIQEVFGPYSLIVLFDDYKQLTLLAKEFPGQLTLSILGSRSESNTVSRISDSLGHIAGRLLFDGVPTGVVLKSTMTHGGPYPATTDWRFTSVGTDAIYRWLRPITYQSCPDDLLPETLQDSNPLDIYRQLNDVWGIH